jgi:hypothetical protein
MKTTALSVALPRHSGADLLQWLLLALAALLLLSSRSFSENPWTSSGLGWSSLDHASSSRGWASWDATRGGTFSDPLPSPSLSMPSYTPHHHHPGFHLPPPPLAVRDSDIDPAMIHAGSIAEQRAHAHSTSMCWRYVKEALVASGSVNRYPQTTYAKEAGRDLVENHGFVRLAVSRPERAPVGAVVVYGGPGAGHVELRTAHGYVSDYRCRWPSGLPFIGAYARVGHHHEQQTENGPVLAAVGAGF